MQETVILLQHPFTLTAYGVGAAFAYLVGCLLCLVNVRKPFALCVTLPFGALIGSRLVYCLANLSNILADFGGLRFLPQLDRGGFSLAGALLGGLLVTAIIARIRKERLLPLLQRLLPSFFIALAVMRLCEVFTPEGIGRFLETETPVFPFTVWSELQYGCVIPVFFWEALAALIGFVYCQVRINGKETLSRGLGWLFFTQIVLESLRGDSYLRFGFVRFHQIMAVIGLLCLLIVDLIQKKPSRKERLVRIVLFAAAVLGAVGIEFALDRSFVSHVLLYALLTLCAAVMLGACAVFSEKPKG